MSGIQPPPPPPQAPQVMSDAPQRRWQITLSWVNLALVPIAMIAYAAYFYYAIAHQQGDAPQDGRVQLSVAFAAVLIPLYTAFCILVALALEAPLFLITRKLGNHSLQENSAKDAWRTAAIWWAYVALGSLVARGIMVLLAPATIGWTVTAVKMKRSAATQESAEPTTANSSLDQ